VGYEAFALERASFERLMIHFLAPPFARYPTVSALLSSRALTSTTSDTNIALGFPHRLETLISTETLNLPYNQLIYHG
jgi:hypothetical protein